MSLIQIKNLTFAYDGSYDNIFENVSFQIDTNWKLGFTGRNGRGKTTFLQLLCGKYPYSGSISACVDFAYFPYSIADKQVDTLAVVERIYPDFEHWKLLRELSRLDVAEDALNRPFETLFNGEQTKMLLAILFLKENSFLLIDEPTNHLDMRGRQQVSQYLNSKRGYILVSHDRAFLDGCVDHILSINKADIEVQRGNFSSWLANRALQDSFELAENERLKKEIQRLQQTAQEKVDWADRAERAKTGVVRVDKPKNYKPYQAAKAKTAMRRAKAIAIRRQEVVAEKEKLLKNIETAEDLKLSQLEYHAKRLVTLRDVSVSYGIVPVCSHITFSIEKGDRIALTGGNGTGKSSLIRLICGKAVPFAGTMEVGSQLRISYVPQDTSSLSGDLSDCARQWEIDESLFKAILRKLGFARVQFEKDMREFSAGQKKKVLLAKSLCEQAHLYIWDEPLNYVDVISRLQIEELLLKFQPTILFVEHDKIFCEKIATKTVSL